MTPYAHTWILTNELYKYENLKYMYFIFNEIDIPTGDTRSLSNISVNNIYKILFQNDR